MQTSMFQTRIQLNIIMLFIALGLCFVASKAQAGAEIKNCRQLDDHYKKVCFVDGISGSRGTKVKVAYSESHNKTWRRTGRIIKEKDGLYLVGFKRTAKYTRDRLLRAGDGGRSWGSSFDSAGYK